jgi:signal transduction histidine kinase
VLGGVFVGSFFYLVAMQSPHGPKLPSTHPGDTLVASLLLTLPLLALRRSPLLTLRGMTVGLAWLVLCFSDRPHWPWPPSALVVYGVVAVLAARAIAPSRLPGVWVWTMAALWISGRGTPDGVLVTLGAAMALLLAVGASLRDRSAAREEAAAANARLDTETGRLAVLAERTRIARELHDVVAHHMTMISVQAEAAPLRTPDLPEPALRAFAVIEQAARQALVETRGIVGLLRGDASDEDEAETETETHGATESADTTGDIGPPERRPSPGLDQIPALVAAAEASGLRADLTMEADPRGIPTSTTLTAYRLIQEGLANAARHAPGAPITVEVIREGAALNVAVINTAPPGEAT